MLLGPKQFLQKLRQYQNDTFRNVLSGTEQGLYAIYILSGVCQSPEVPSCVLSIYSILGVSQRN